MRSCLIVGAGLAGLVAARTLRDADTRITVLEKEEKVGGRMRTDRIGNGVFDHGAQFFTVRGKRFEEVVKDWIHLGLVEEWTRGFADQNGEYRKDGHPRYKGTGGMTAIAEYLAQGIDVQTGAEVSRIVADEKGWKAVTSDSVYGADVLVLTPPWALALVDSNGIHLPPEARSILEGISYDPCIAVMALLDDPGRVPEPGGVQIGGDPLFWVADNRKKEISEAPAITIHAGPVWSREHARSDDVTITRLLLEEAKDYVGTRVKATEVYRWEYSQPIEVHKEPFVYVEGPPPLIFCGDAYAGPKVEGAVLSGLNAAEKLLESASCLPS